MTTQKTKHSEASGDVPGTMGALEAITLAIYNEQAAYEFYNGLAGVIENERGRSTFQSLARDEASHRRRLEDLYEQENGGRTFRFDPARVQPVEFDVENQTGAVDALDIALEAEKSAAAFYRRAAGETADESGRQMFEHLAADEDRHFEILQAEREAVLGGLYWFGTDEQRLMEG